MSEDPLLRELGHLAKEEKEAEQARLDERWDRLAAATLTVEEEAELRALAAASPEAREAYEAFRPLGPEFQARMADALAAELKKPEGESEKRRPRLLPFRPPAAWRFAGWSTAAAAVFAGLFLIFRPLVPGSPLPIYAFADLSGGVQSQRGESNLSSEPQLFASGDHFQAVLSPTTKTPGKDLEARCFLVRGRDLRRLEVQSQLDPEGAVKMDGSIASNLLPGTWTLWVIVGRQGKLPDGADPQFFGQRAAIRQRDWVAVPKDIQIHPRGP